MSATTEVRAGIATFLTMSYILFVNPAILSAAGLPFEAVAVATALAAAIATAAMALATNLPFALAPGLGINAVVAFDIILGRNLPWQVGMAVVVIEGLLALVLVLAGLREAGMRAAPLSLQPALGGRHRPVHHARGAAGGGDGGQRPGGGEGVRRPPRRPAADRPGRPRRRH